ncbi:MAG TPA: GxxExxY protein [Pyrinomonadaceae bacterium]
MVVELGRRGIPFSSECELELYYKNVKLEKMYRADFVCYDQIIVELKVVPRISNVEVAQVMNYLKITRKRVGVLFNFGSRPTLEWRRYVI